MNYCDIPMGFGLPQRWTEEELQCLKAELEPEVFELIKNKRTTYDPRVYKLSRCHTCGTYRVYCCC